MQLAHVFLTFLLDGVLKVYNAASMQVVCNFKREQQNTPVVLLAFRILVNLQCCMATKSITL